MLVVPAVKVRASKPGYAVMIDNIMVPRTGALNIKAQVLQNGLQSLQVQFPSLLRKVAAAPLTFPIGAV